MPPSAPHNAQGQLLEAVLSEVHFKRNPVYDYELGPVTYTLDAETKATVTDDREHGIVDLYVTVNFQREGDQTDDPFELMLVVRGLFEWMQPDLPDEEIEGWLAFNGEHLLWPYLRTYVSMITSASGAPPLTIYTISVPRPHLGHSDESSVTVEDVGH